MANSLMELYGGGMMGPSNNYQLGGRIASSKRQSEYQGETRTLKEASEEAARRQRKSGIWGGIGSFVGGTLGSVLGPWGTAAGAAFGRGLGESGYKEVDVGGGKYRQQTREDIAKGQEEYKEGRLERALVSGAMAGIMPEVYGAAGKWLKGLGGAKEAAQVADIAGAVPEFAAGFGTAPVHEGMAASGLQLPGMPELGAVPSMSMEGFGSGMAGKLGAMPTTTVASQGLGAYTGSAAENLAMARKLGLDLSGGQTVRGAFEGGGYGPWGTHAGEWYGSLFPDSGVQLASRRGGGLINYIVPQMQGGGMTSQYGYGTATDPLGALKQMGMHGIAADPKLAQYMGDLPQFGMGYEQQIGDIRTGAQKRLMGLAQPTAPAATSFAGEGASGVAQQQARKGTMQQYGTQSRGVVEGYQADVLGAIRDIEQKGEFEFQSPWTKTGETEEDWRRRTAAEQDLLAGQESQLYSQEGLYGLLDPTVGQTGGNTTGWPGQQPQWGQSQQQQNPWQQQTTGQQEQQYDEFGFPIG